jgi:PKD repeat protein
VLADCDGSTSTSADLTATNLTIVGPAATAVGANCDTHPFNAHVSIDSSILRGASHALVASTPALGETASIDPAYDDYDPSTDVVTGAGMVHDPGVGQINADPLFISPQSGDLRIPFRSPAVDAGDPAPLGFFDSTTDLNGQPRVVGGRRDIGAFEYQRQPPTASIAQDLTSAIVGQPVHFNGSGSADPDPGDTLSYAWTFDDGATATTAVVAHAFATTGTHTVHLTVTDPTALTASATATVVVTAAPPLTLTLTGVTESHSTWRLGSGHATISRSTRAKAPVGTTFGFTVNEAATIRLTFMRTVRGRIRARKPPKCVAQTPANKHRPGCTRSTLVGSISFHATTGPHSVHFEGPLGPHNGLSPGHYAAIVTAIDATGKPAPPRTLSFTVVK